MTSPLTTDVIDQALDQLDLEYFRGRGDARVVMFGPWASCPSFRVVIEDPQAAPVLHLVALPSVAFPLEAQPDLLSACNAWNRDRRWPRVFAATDDESVDVIGDANIPAMAGLSVEQIVENIVSFVSSSRQFWEQMTADADPMDGILNGFASLLDDASNVGDDSEP